MTIAQIKALFQTGKIPTQADFENLINKIPNDDLTGLGDSTLKLYNPSAPHVRGYRFISIDDHYTYIFLGLYDASNGTVIPYIILRCSHGRPLEETGIVSVDYTILDGSKMNAWYSTAGNKDMHDVDDDTCINAIPSDIIWRNVGLPYGKMLSSYHIILEANEVYEKHWFDIGSPHGIIVEFAKTNLSVDKWIFIRSKQISLVNNTPDLTIRVPNGTSKADSTYDSKVQQIRESTERSTNITTFLDKYTTYDIPSYCETPFSDNNIIPGPGTYTVYYNLLSSTTLPKKILIKYYITIIDSKLVLYKFEHFTYYSSTGSTKREIGIIKSLDDNQVDKLTINSNSNFLALIDLITTDNFTIKTQ